MTYDDIADYDLNPHKGEIYNNPNGINVYDKEDISYRGKDVNA